MGPPALFLHPEPAVYVPTEAASSAWDTGLVHGAAVGALFAGRLRPDDGTLARLSIEFLRPIPSGPLRLVLDEPVGGRRVRRRQAVLERDGRTVASATALVVAAQDLELPERTRRHDLPFPPEDVPPLDEPNRDAASVIGVESFDTMAAVVVPHRIEGDRRQHLWTSLVLPVVEGTELQGIEVALVAADYAQGATHRQLPFADWTFRNAEQTVHFSRTPTGPWIGIRSEAVAQPVGTGFNAADLYDADGRVGRSAATLVVERRDAP